MQSELNFQINNEAMISIEITKVTISSSLKELDFWNDRISRESHVSSSLEIVPYNVRMV